MWGGGGGEGGGVKAFLQLANFTLGPDAALNTVTHKNSVRIKAPNSVNASKRKHKTQINHYNKQRRVLMAQSMHQSENIKIKLITIINKDEYSWLILMYARVNKNQ